MRSFLGQNNGEIVCYDEALDDRYPEDDLAKCDFVAVCVDTPMLPDGTCDTSKVESAVRRVPNQLLLLKSTVAPTTTDRLVALTDKQICFSPEFIGQPTYCDPGLPTRVEHIPYVILGGAPATRHTFAELLVPLLGPLKTYFQCSALEAEIIKYMENSFLATKVSFVNEFFEICKAFDADWHTVREGWLLDPRVGRSHSAVFTPARGFSGKCLVKDVSAIVRAADEAGYGAALLAEVLKSNERFRADESDGTGVTQEP
jgi:nucleotide sugar dehydrogenase